MLKRKRIEIKIEGSFMSIGVNNVIRMVNRIPFVRIDAVYNYSDNSTALVYISTPFELMRSYLTEKLRKNHNYKIIWL